MKILRFICVFFFLCTASGHAAPLLHIQQVRSPGGIEAWLVEDHTVPVIAVKFAFKDAGACQDPADKQGLARMLSNTMDEGAGDLNSQDFQKTLRDLSIGLSFDASRDDFSGTLKTLSANKDRAFDLLHLALIAPRFDDEAIARMKDANISRILSSLSDPNWIAARLINDRVFAHHPYAQNSGGTVTSLKNITADDLKAFHDHALARDNLMVAVSGDIDAATLAKALDRIFANLPERAEIAPVPQADFAYGGMTGLYKVNIPQTIIEIEQPMLPRQDPDYFKAEVMNFIFGSSGFGSRLMEDIREKRGLTYGIYSAMNHLSHFDGLTISTSTANKNVADILELTRANMKRMVDETVSAGELRDAKSYLLGSLPLSMTSTDDIAELLLSLQVDRLGVDYLDRRAAAIEAMTAQDIQTIAARILKPDRLAVVLVGGADALPDTHIIDSVPNVQ